MLLFFLLTFVAGAIVCREKNGGPEFFIGVFAAAGILLCVAGLEIASGSVEPLKSDELFYINTATESELGDLWEKKRALWHGVNYWVLNVDAGFGGLALKIVNIPLYTLLIYLFYRLFDRRKMIWLLPVFLPYSLWVSTFNFRDVPILLSTTLVVFFYAKKGIERYYAIIPLIMLFMLRPFFAFVVVAVISGLEMMRLMRDALGGSISKRGLASLAVGSVFACVVILVFWEPIARMAFGYYKQFIITTGDGRAGHLERIASAYKSQSILKDLAVSMVRYAATPIPTSMLERTLEGGSPMWGVVDDVVRLVHQTVYYGMVVYLLGHWRRLLLVLKNFRMEQKIFVVTFLTNWPIYSFYLYGVTHQRSKLPLQIVIFLLVVGVWSLQTRTRNSAATNNRECLSNFSGSGAT